MARLNKVSKNFRLNVEFIALLEALASKHNTTLTDTLELAIAELAKTEIPKEDLENIVRESIYNAAYPKGS